ncbi:MAG: Do family serine endopeptidase [Hyphomicrobiales bacterium]|nr:Do family serine endopeptidase [Hyphomicrobiales bacterium]
MTLGSNTGGSSRRRLALLAGVAGLAIAAGFGSAPHSFSTILPAHAADVQRPAGFADVAEKVKPAVVAVRVKRDAGAKLMTFEGERDGSMMERFRRRFGMPEGGKMPGETQPKMGQGSGFFITADGYVVTNNHVVENAGSIEVTTDDGKTFAAKLIGTDARTDLALIKVDGRNDFAHVKVAEKAPRIGDWVLAVGNPFGLGGSVTAGIVSARGRDIGAGPYDDFLQIDASVNQGNSGGPTFDMDGNVIGVNTAIFSPSGGSVGIAFAVPAETVKSVVAQLKDTGFVKRGWIGVQIQPVTADIADSLGMKQAEGALVVEPQSEGPAAKAGVLGGDVVTAINGRAVKDARDLARRIGAMSSGTSAKLTLWRNGAEKTVSLTIGELPKERAANAATADAQGKDAKDTKDASSEAPKLGMMLAPAAQVAGSGSDGVVIMEVQPDSIAAGRGLKTGDIILEVAGKKVVTPVDVRNAIGDAHKNGKHSVLMRLKSDDAMRFVAVPLARA